MTDAAIDAAATILFDMTGWPMTDCRIAVRKIIEEAQRVEREQRAPRRGNANDLPEGSVKGLIEAIMELSKK